MPFQLKPFSLALAGACLCLHLSGAAFAQSPSRGANTPVWTYPPYERSGGDASDPFSSEDTAACRSQYQSEIQQIEADHQQGGQNCRFPGNGACHAANNQQKAARLQRANQQLFQCNRQAQTQQGQSTRGQAAAQVARIDDEAIRQQQQAQLAREQAQYARELSAARAREAAAARAAEQARRQEELRRWREANRFIDVLAGRRPPLP
jgi:hypothetical protein